MRAIIRRHHRRSGGDPSLQAAAALRLAEADIARAVGDGLYRSSGGRNAITAGIETTPQGACLVLTARHRELAASTGEARGAIAAILRSAWVRAGKTMHLSGGTIRGD